MPTVDISANVGPQWVVPHECVKLKNVLSENAHMTIFKGTMTVKEEVGSKTVSVAAKTIKGGTVEGVVLPQSVLHVLLSSPPWVHHSVQ